MMKKLTMLVFGAIFVTLIASSIQSISADDIGSNEEFSEDENTISFSKYAKQTSFSSTKDSKYHIHTLIEVRNAQGQLISVSETMGGKYLAHEVTDHVFDGMSDKKEVIVIDNVEYQKVQVTMTQRMEDVPMWWQQDIHSKWFIEYCISVNGQNTCGIAFASISPHIFLAEGEVLEIHWTILRAVN